MISIEEWPKKYNQILENLPDHEGSGLVKKLEKLNLMMRACLDNEPPNDYGIKILAIDAAYITICLLREEKKIKNSNSYIDNTLYNLTRDLDELRRNQQSLFLKNIISMIQANQLESARNMLSQAEQIRLELRKVKLPVASFLKKNSNIPQQLFSHFLSSEVESEFRSCVQLLSEKGFDFNAPLGVEERDIRGWRYENPCARACRYPNPQMKLTTLMTYGADINIHTLNHCGSKKYSPAHIASETTNNELMKLLITKGAKPDINAEDLVSFFDAEMNVKNDDAQAMINLFILNNSGENLLKAALSVEKDNIFKTIKALMALGAKPYPDIMSDVIKKNYIDLVVPLLHEFKAFDIRLPHDIPENVGLNMFQTCFKNGLGLSNYSLSDLNVLKTPAAVLACLQRGDKLPRLCDVPSYDRPRVYELDDNTSQSMFSAAFVTVYGDSESLALLINAGLVDVHFKDDEELTLLHYAAAEGGYVKTDTVKILILAGADINAQDFQKRTPLHVAVAGNASFRRTIGSVEALLYAGADPALLDIYRKKLENARYTGNAKTDFDYLPNWKKVFETQPRDNNISVGVTTPGVPTLFQLAAARMIDAPESTRNLVYRNCLSPNAAVEAENIMLKAMSPSN